MVRVVIVATRGSAPREAGACMLVAADSVHGTIGGGHLEWQATTLARAMLAGREGEDRNRLTSFTLGATLGQCCGGVVDLWFERFDANDQEFFTEARGVRARHTESWMLTALQVAGDPDATQPMRHRLMDGNAPEAKDLRHATRQTIAGTAWYVERLNSALPAVWLFGAGHVGYALAQVLGTLPVALTWIDNRPGLLPLPVAWPHSLHGAPLTIFESDDPASEVAHAPAGTHFLVMTHSHDLDLDICRALLRRHEVVTDEPVGLMGLIGSRTKAARFRHRLAAQGLAAERITCPLGLPDIRAKHPGAVALSIAAHLQACLEAQADRSAALPARPSSHATGTRS